MPRPDVSEKRKAQIIAAAITAFAQNGYEKTRMEDIAASAGLSKGTLYWYFKSKEEIFSAIQARLMENQFSWLLEAVQAEGPVATRLLQFVDRFSGEVTTLSSLQSLFFEMFAPVWRDEQMRQMVQGRFHAALDMLAALLQEGIAQGEFRADIDVTETAVALVAMHEGLELAWMMAPDRIDLPAMKRKLLSDMLANLR